MFDRPMYYLLDEQGNPYPTDDTQRYETREQAEEGHEAVSEGVEQVLMQLGERNLDSIDIAGLLEAAQP